MTQALQLNNVIYKRLVRPHFNWLKAIVAQRNARPVGSWIGRLRMLAQKLPVEVLHLYRSLSDESYNWTYDVHVDVNPSPNVPDLQIRRSAIGAKEELIVIAAQYVPRYPDVAEKLQNMMQN